MSEVVSSMGVSQGSEFYLMGRPIEPVTVSSAGHDAFHWNAEMNKASTVMLAEQGIVDAALARTIAKAVAAVIADGARPGAARPGNYMVIEKLLVAAGGPEVTRVHSGRSRQDMLATSHRLFLRDQLLDTFDDLARLREALLALARRHAHDLVPAYTHSVQAQPTTLGHYLGAFAAAFERDAARMRETYARLNLSPLGAGALGTSSFPLDRVRLAQLLGFDGPVENSFDANLVAPCDLSVEVAALATSGALTSGSLLADLLAQYRNASPWLTLRADGLTGTSTMMPQKQNPIVLVAARHQASETLSAAHACTMVAHNIGSGYLEHRGNEALRALQAAARLYAMMSAALSALVFDPARARAEIDADYSTTTGLADVLQREAGVPFRIGHHFAAALVGFGRSSGLRCAEIGFDDARRIYAEIMRTGLGAGQELPLSERRFREVLSPENMVRSSRGLGGPQPSEVVRMLEAHEARLAADRQWLGSRRAALAASSRMLDEAFGHLLH